MQVTVIGAGNMGRGIGHRLVAGGHAVTIVDRARRRPNGLQKSCAARRRAARPSKRPNLAQSYVARR
jgi:3-hydroxyacyl-CoA dehydrogenase